MSLDSAGVVEACKIPYKGWDASPPNSYTFSLIPSFQRFRDLINSSGERSSPATPF